MCTMYTQGTHYRFDDAGTRLKVGRAQFRVDSFLWNLALITVAE